MPCLILEWLEHSFKKNLYKGEQAFFFIFFKVKPT